MKKIACILTLLLPYSCFACDICSVYAAFGAQELSSDSLHIGLLSQFTDMDEVREDGRKVENPYDERLRSSISQILFSYDVSSKLALQMNVPLLYRSFRRNEEGVRRSGSESGLGDISLLMRARPYRSLGERSLVQFELFGGIKLPTGDSDRLREEIAEEHSHGHSEQAAVTDSDEAHHHEEGMHHHEHEEEAHHALSLMEDSHGDMHSASAVHGHDLAIGTGSVDFPFGGAFLARYGRVVANVVGQYTFRSTGRFDYRYGDDAILRAGVGGYLLLEDEHSALLRLVVSGERKSKDKRHGESFEQTYMRALYVGPEATVSLGDRFSAELAWDIPVDVDTDGLMISPTSRIRFGATYRF